MTASHALKKYISQHHEFEEKVQRIFSQKNIKSPILDEQFYSLAEQISKIQGFENIAEALLTSESPEKIDPKALLEFWRVIVYHTPSLCTDFDPLLSQQLHSLILSLENRTLHLSPQLLTHRLKRLKENDKFHLLLPHQTPFGPSLEHAVIYSKNLDRSINIQLFYAKKNCWEQQGGEYALGQEKIFPVRVYSRIPECEIFGPNFDGTQSLHSEILLRAINDKISDKSSFLAVFAPFNAYLEEPLPETHQIQVEHAHSLKSIHAFLYACIEDFCVGVPAADSYKAFLCLCRLILSLAVMKSISLEEDEQSVHKKYGLLIEASMATARHLSKQINNPFLHPLYEKASGTLELLKEEAQKLQREPLHLDMFFAQHKIPVDQHHLINVGTKKITDFLHRMHSMQPEKVPNKHSIDPCLDPCPIENGEFILWLKKIEKKIRFLHNSQPHFVIPLLNHLASLLELPSQEDNRWKNLTLKESKIALDRLNFFSEELVKESFKQSCRFSAEVQNTAAKFLLIAYVLAEKLEEKSILTHFRPALKGFHKLSRSPNFHIDHCSEWVDRQNIFTCLKLWKQRKPIFFFQYSRKKTFVKSFDEEFAKAIFKAYPEIYEATKRHYLTLKKQKNEAFSHVSIEQLLVALLTNKKISGFRNTQEIESIFKGEISKLVQIALYTHLLNDPHAKPQKGYNDTIDLETLNVNFKYVKNGIKVATDFQNKNPLKNNFNFKQRNLFSRLDWIENQNHTLFRFANVEDVADYIQFFEEVASEPHLTCTLLLGHFKAQFTHLSDSNFLHAFENYLFKILIHDTKEEIYPLIEEIKRYPQVFNQLLIEFLNSFKVFSSKLVEGHFAEPFKNAIELSIRLYPFAKHQACLSLLDTLTQFLSDAKKHLIMCLKKSQGNGFSKQSVELRICLLKILELQLEGEWDWIGYFIWGSPLQKQLDQKEFFLDPVQKHWWDHLRWMAANKFKQQNKFFPFVLIILREKQFNILEMTATPGQFHPIPHSIVTHPEFIHLFGDRLREWKIEHEAKEAFFVDPLTGEYKILDIQKFPYGLQRKIENTWYTYLPIEEVLEVLHVPLCFQKECIWWISPNGYVKGYFKSKPNVVWLEHDSERRIVFKHGSEKGFILELIKKYSTSDLEDATGSFGNYYHAYKHRLLANKFQINLRSRLVFPYLKMPDGEALVFERLQNEFCIKGQSEKKLKDCVFVPSVYNDREFYQTTALKVFGIVVEKKLNTLRNESETYIILPFQKYVSETHSSVVRPLDRLRYSASQSELNAIETIEIKTDLFGFSPENPAGVLFAAYLSLVGKQYNDAAKFLKGVRPGYRLNKNDQMIICWLVDSGEDAQDHSASAAAIKLLAYRILIEQGLSIIEEIDHSKLPQESLESIYRSYLDHLASVPSTLRLSQEQEEWLLDKGLKTFSEDPDELWVEHRRKLQGHEYEVSIFHLNESSKRSLFDIWSEPYRLDNKKSITLSIELFEGILQPTEEGLHAGKKYPEKSFGWHYQFFSQYNHSSYEQWALIHTLETVDMPDFLKNSLKIAYLYKEKSIPLPALKTKNFYENSPILEAWFEEVLHSLPFKIQENPINRKVYEHTKQVNPLLPSIEDKFSEKIASMIRKYKTLSPYEMIHALRRAFASHLSPVKPLIKLECPFTNINTLDDFFNEELKIYREEWSRGLELQKNAKIYSLPSHKEIDELNQLLHMHANEIQGTNFENHLVQLLNRRPLNADSIVFARLAEVKGEKTYLTIQDAFEMAFIQEFEDKLIFLRQRNPFLAQDDLEVIIFLLKDYLEWHIHDRILQQVKNKLQLVTDCIQQNKNWRINAEVLTVWQEIAELLNPFDNYSKNPQIQMETLIFEFFSGFRLREEQVVVLHDTLKVIFNPHAAKRDFAFVFQVIMGGGKTSVILAQLAKWASAHDKVPILITHHSQYVTHKNLPNTQFKNFGQDVIDLDFNRYDLASIKTLKYINDQLVKAQEDKRLILVKSSFMLILRQEFIDQFRALKDPQNFNPFILERIRELAKVLHFIKCEVIFLGDEIDWVLNILEELIFSAGISLPISNESLDVIKQVYTILATDAGISKVLNLTQDNQTLVTEEKLKELFKTLVHVLVENYPPLAELIPLKKYQIFRQSLVDYLLNTIDPRLMDGIDAEDEEQFIQSLNLDGEEIFLKAKRDLKFLRHLFDLKAQVNLRAHKGLIAAALINELCFEILPKALAKGLKQRYGFNESGKAIPYYGVGVPNHKNEFGNIYLNTCCYFQAALGTGVTVDRLKKYRDQLRETSQYHSELYHCSPDESAEAQHFKKLIGLSLHQEWSEEEIVRTLESINQNPQKCLDFYGEFAPKVLCYHTSLLNCGPISLSYMPFQFIGCSGTLWNKESFARSIAEKTVTQIGIEGRILVKLAQDLSQKKSFISLIDQATPHAILNGVFEKHGVNTAKRLRAIIDDAGLLKRFPDQEEVAQQILNYKPLEEEIEAVFFVKINDTQEEFSLLKRGEKNRLTLPSADRKYFEKHKVNINHVFFLYDELRSMGLNALFKKDGIAVLTFDPMSTPMRTTIQGALRARDFFYAQNVDVVLLKESLSGFYAYDKNKPLSCLTVNNFFLTALYNQSQMKKIQYLQSAIEQLRENYASRIVLKNVSHIIKNNHIDDQTIELFAHASWLFYSEFRDDPIQSFLHLKKKILAYEFVQNYYNCIRERFHTSCASYFDDEEIKLMEEGAQAILDWSRTHLIWEVLDRNSDIKLDTQVEVYQEIQNEVEVNTQMMSEVQKELQKYHVRIDALCAQYKPWTPKIEKPQSFKDYDPPEILSLQNFFKRVPYEFPYHEIFPKNLYLTGNLAQSLEVDVPFFHKIQKNVSHILLIREEDHYFPLFIDLKEAFFWREEIRDSLLKDCWLMNLEGLLLNEDSILPEEAQSIINRILWWAHFFNGDVNYLRKFPLLVQEELKKQDYALKIRFLYLKNANQPFQTKILRMDPVLADEPLDEPMAPFKHQEEEDAWRAKEILHLTVEELNQLPFHFARYFSKEQISLIYRSGFFSYLMPEQFVHIDPQQVFLIPDVRLKYLSLPMQVAMVSPEKICWLQGRAMQYVSEEHLDKINPNELVNLLPHMQISYQNLMIKRRGLESFSKSISPQMAPASLEACVAFIQDPCIPHLRTREQLDKVPIHRYPLLRASQFHLLPQEKWYHLELKDFKKYSKEEIISDDAHLFIQDMPIEWVNQVDPRLAAYYTDLQVEHINQPKCIKYLNVHQLEFLNAAFAKYLEPSQIQALSAKHRHLIIDLKEPILIHKLSEEGIQELDLAQLKYVIDRETLLRLPSKFFMYLSSKQIMTLKAHESDDQKVFKCLTKEQLQQLDSLFTISLLPYIDEKELKSISPLLFSQASSLSMDIRTKLTHKQLQCFLREQKIKNKDLETYVKDITKSQWREMDHVFIHSFFSQVDKNVLKYVPKNRVQFLPRGAVLRWYHAEGARNRMQDRVIGAISLVFYPLMLLSVILIALLRIKKKESVFKIFRRTALSPLRLFARVNYYRLISQ